MSERFDWLCFKEPGEMLLDKNITALGEMESWLRAQGKHDAADELYAYKVDLEAQARRLGIKHQRLEKLMLEAEQWYTGDHGEDAFEDAWSEMIGVPSHTVTVKLTDGRNP